MLYIDENGEIVTTGALRAEYQKLREAEIELRSVNIPSYGRATVAGLVADREFRLSFSAENYGVIDLVIEDDGDEIFLEGEQEVEEKFPGLVDEIFRLVGKMEVEK